MAGAHDAAIHLPERVRSIRGRRQPTVAEKDGSIEEPVGEVEVVTDMATAAFTRKNTLVPARQHVSAMLVGGFGTYPDVRVLGVLHPEALHPLPAEALSETPLCYWRRWPPAREVEIAWTDDPAS